MIIIVWILLNFEVNLLFELFWLCNLDDFVLGVQSLLDELKREVEPSLHEVSLIIGEGPLIHFRYSIRKVGNAIDRLNVIVNEVDKLNYNKKSFS
jgi:hypothetical protein